jgi:hypothetical protein
MPWVDGHYEAIKIEKTRVGTTPAQMTWPEIVKEVRDIAEDLRHRLPAAAAVLDEIADRHAWAAATIEDLYATIDQIGMRRYA